MKICERKKQIKTPDVEPYAIGIISILEGICKKNQKQI